MVYGVFKGVLYIIRGCLELVYVVFRGVIYRVSRCALWSV